MAPDTYASLAPLAVNYNVLGRLNYGFSLLAVNHDTAVHDSIRQMR